jgi:hypothetical protein
MMELADPHPAVRRPLHAGRLRRELAITGSDILGPSEAFRAPMDYYAHSPDDGRHARAPRPRSSRQVLACMHGSAWQGDGAALLRALARSLDEKREGA